MKVSLEGGESLPFFQQESAMQMFPRLSNEGNLIAFSTMEFDKGNTKFNRSVKVFTLNGGAVGELKKKFDLSLGYYYNFFPSGKNLTYINKQGIENLSNLPLS